MNFVTPLNVHSEYEIAQSTIKLKDYITFAKDNNFRAVALTDNSTMSGIVEFCKLAKNNNLKPLVGVQFNICPQKQDRMLLQIILFAKNTTGFKNLVQLTTYANLEWENEVPRIDINTLKKHSKGLICIVNHLYPIKYEKSLWQEIKSYKNIFNNDLYIGLSENSDSSNEENNSRVIKWAQMNDIEVVISDEVRYLKREEQKTLENFQLYYINSGNKNVEYFFDDYYFKRVDELRKNFKYLKDNQFYEYLNNIDRIISECNVDLDKIYNFNKLPKFKVPQGYTAQTYLEKLVKDGISELYPEITKEVEERYKYELKIINDKNLADYFLIVWDYVNFMIKGNISYGFGRGYAPSSIVCYALKITKIDPIKNNLIFERFLNPENNDMPDIDIDWGFYSAFKRQEYIYKKYKNQVAKIISFGEFTNSTAFYVLCSANGISKREYLKIYELIKNGTDINELCEQNPKFSDFIKTAEKLKGLKYNKSVHIAGRLISAKKLKNYIPLEYDKDGEIISQYSRYSLDDLGFIKFDFIPNKELSFALGLAKDIKLDINTIPFDDEKTFKLIQNGGTNNIYGLSSDDCIKYLKRLKPNNFGELCNVISLYRQKPIEMGLMDEYIERKNGKNFKINSLIKPILEDTYGILIYEEQAIQIIKTLAGCTLGQAETIRNSIKKGDLTQKDLIEKFMANGFEKEVVQEISEMLITYTPIAFSKSHVIGLTMLSYYEAYLKAHYPKYFVV